MIGLAAFEEAGGLAGAIGRRPRRSTSASTSDDARPLAACPRLVTVSDDRDDTRRRARRTELEQVGIATDDLHAVLDEYGRHRLLTFDRDPTSRTPTVEVAHESLLTDWERFAGWIDDAREDLLTRRRLESATHEWISSDCDPSFLIGGGRLELTESWAASSRFELTHEERPFPGHQPRERRSRPGRAHPRRRVIADRSPQRSSSRPSAPASPRPTQQRRTVSPRSSGRRRRSRREQRQSRRQPRRRRATQPPTTPAPSPRPAASARKHWSTTTTTRRCFSPWKGDTSRTRRRHGRTCSPPSNAAPTRWPSSGARPKPSSTSGSRRTARRCSPADRRPPMSKYDVTTRHAGSLHPRHGEPSPARSVPTAAYAVMSYATVDRTASRSSSTSWT